MDMRKMIEDFHAEYNKAFDAGDAPGCSKFFTEDVVLMPPDGPMIRGRQAFEASYRSRMGKNSGGTHTNKLVEFGVEGDMAYEIGTFAIEGSDTPEQGKFVNILRRQVDGSWMVTVSIFNSDGV